MDCATPTAAGGGIAALSSPDDTSPGCDAVSLPSSTAVLWVRSLIALLSNSATGELPDPSEVSTTRWTLSPGMADHDNPGNEFDPVDPGPAAGAEGLAGEGLGTDAIGAESDTSGAKSTGSSPTRRCAVGGSPPVEAVGVGRVVVAIESAEGECTGFEPGCTEPPTTRWTADTVDGLGAATGSAAEVASGEITPGLGGASDPAADAIGGKSDTSGAASIGPIPTSIRGRATALPAEGWPPASGMRCSGAPKPKRRATSRSIPP
jgi:hypothetical protein